MPIPLLSGNSYYYTDEFKTIMRSCKEVLINSATYSPFIEDGIKFAYRYNFHKFLRQLKTDKSSATAIPEELIWVISFINGIEDPNQDFTHLTGIITVNREIVDNILQTTRTKRE